MIMMVLKIMMIESAMNLSKAARFANNASPAGHAAARQTHPECAEPNALELQTRGSPCWSTPKKKWESPVIDIFCTLRE